MAPADPRARPRSRRARGPRFVVIGDLNADGKADIVAANQLSNTASVFLGTGTGSFSGPGIVPIGTDPFAVAIGDVSGDGKPDLVSANATPDSLYVLLGDGAGASARRPPIRSASNSPPTRWRSATWTAMASPTSRRRTTAPTRSRSSRGMASAPSPAKPTIRWGRIRDMWRSATSTPTAGPISPSRTRAPRRLI